MIDRKCLRQRYDLLLQEFFSSMEERALYGVSELARELVAAKIGPDLLLDLHTQCLNAIIADLDPVTAGRNAMIANDLLLNGIMTYSISFYSFAETLEEKNRELELRRKEAEAARREADTANKAKSDFLANMSHELRTPLTSVIGFAGVLKEEMSGTLNPKQHEQVNYIIASGKHLLDLINDILDLSKVEAGKLELEPSRFALRPLLEGSMAMLMEKALKLGVTLSLTVAPDADVEIEADVRKLKQIMFNLLSNAVKFTPEGGSVRIDARLCGEGAQHRPSDVEPDRSFIEISVEDTGIGIKAEDMGRLFTEFTQLESPYLKNQEGTGLGLALSRRLVELHGGRIRAESEFGKGARFSFVIPVGTVR